MSERVAGLTIIWGLALALWFGSVPGVLAGQDNAAADQAEILAALQGEGAHKKRPAAGAVPAAEFPVKTGAHFPVLCWELQDQDLFIFRHNMGDMDWRQVRHERKIRMDAWQNKKLLKLVFWPPNAGSHASLAKNQDWLKKVRVLMRDPDGSVKEMKPPRSLNEAISVPEGQGMNGRYVLSAQLNLGKADYDHDGIEETLNYYTKQFISHRGNDLPTGTRPEVFFNNADQVAFEIGPVVINARRKMGGDMQRPHNAYKMMVKYKAKPLPGARVSIYVQGGGWQQHFTTNQRGVFTIMPPDDRFGNREWQKYLYVAEHYDQENHSYHIATFPVIVTKNQPEWRSKAMGFSYWSIFGSALIIMVVAGLSWRKKRQNQRSLVIFENSSIKKD
jgi:hypothetical protein